MNKHQRNIYLLVPFPSNQKFLFSQLSNLPSKNSRQCVYWLLTQSLLATSNAEVNVLVQGITIHSAVPAVLDILETFGAFSKFKIKLEKSVCFPINTAAQYIKRSDLPCQLSLSGFKYLGVNVTPTISHLTSANF